MRLPVFTAFGASVGYVFSHLGTLLRIVWLPALLLTAVTYYLTTSLLEAQLNLAMTEPEQASQAAAIAAFLQNMETSGWLLLAQAAFYPMMIAGVLKYVLNGEAPRAPFYLWFGLHEARVLIAYVLLVIMLIIAGVAAFLGFFVISVFVSFAGAEAAAVVVGLVPLAIMAAFVWFLLRMSLVFSAAVAERSIGLAQSWRLTDHAAWSLFFFWLFWIVFMTVLSIPFMLVAAKDFFAFLPEIVAAAGDEAASADIERRMLSAQVDMMNPARPGFWLAAAATWAYTMVVTAFWTAAGGVAYSYLADRER